MLLFIYEIRFGKYFITFYVMLAILEWSKYSEIIGKKIEIENLLYEAGEISIFYDYYEFVR